MVSSNSFESNTWFGTCICSECGQVIVSGLAISKTLIASAHAELAGSASENYKVSFC